MSYAALKHAHMLFVVTSLFLFIVRGILMMAESGMLQKKIFRVMPHIIDTLLLASAIALTFTINQYPFAQSWLTAKLIALLVYIGIGTVAIKRGKNKQVRTIAFFAAIVVFLYIAAVARTHNPLPFI